ncbi:Protein nedd1 [Podila epigama]|nr:Protein nedd1 [Podila epigama]
MPKPARLYFANGYKVLTMDLATKWMTECFEARSRINVVAISSDDLLLAVGQNSGALNVLNRTTGSISTLDTPTSLIMAKLEYSVFNRSLLGGTGNDGILRLWDTGPSGSTSVFHSFPATHSVPISGMAFSPFNKYLICTTGLDGRYSLYDVEQKSVVKNTLTDHPLTSIAFKSDGVSMAFGTDHGKILLYDLRSTSRPTAIVDTGVNAAVSSIHFQGKSSSVSKNHSSGGSGGHALKRQNSAGEKTMGFGTKDSDPSVAASVSTTSTAAQATRSSSSSLLLNSNPISTATESAAAQPYKSIFSKPTAIRTSTLSNPTINLLGGHKSTRETQSAGTVAKTMAGVFPTIVSTPLSSTSSLPSLSTAKATPTTSSTASSGTSGTGVRAPGTATTTTGSSTPVLLAATTSTTPNATEMDSEMVVSFKPQRPPPPASIATKSLQGHSSVNGQPSLAFSSSSAPTSATTPTTKTANPYQYHQQQQTTPGTPVREKLTPTDQPLRPTFQGSHPNSRTVSPFSFQMMRSRSPSGSPSSMSSTHHTPPGSPAHGTLAKGQHDNKADDDGVRGILGPKKSGKEGGDVEDESHLQHHHYYYQSGASDPSLGRASPSASRAKRRKSFGALLASGGVGSESGSGSGSGLDVLSKERMEIISGQMADRVRKVLLNATEPIGSTGGSSSLVEKTIEKRDGGKGGSSISSGHVDGGEPTVSLGSQLLARPSSTEKGKSVSSRPFKDLWLQAGSESGEQSRTTTGVFANQSSTSMVVDTPLERGADNAKGRGGNEGGSNLTGAPGAPGARASEGMTLPSFSSKVLENVIEGCLAEFRTGIRNDIQNMHLELLRQFQIQKLEMETLLKEYSNTQELREQIERLEEENRKLKLNY